MRRVAIVFLAILACCSAYPLEETQQIAIQVPEVAPQVSEFAVEEESTKSAGALLESEKDAVELEASEIVQTVATPESEAGPSNAEQLLEVDAGVSASPELVREARQFLGGIGGFGGLGFPGYGGYGRYPGYGGFGGYAGYGGYGRYPGFGRYGGYGRYPYGFAG